MRVSLFPFLGAKLSLSFPRFFPGYHPKDTGNRHPQCNPQNGIDQMQKRPQSRRGCYSTPHPSCPARRSAAAALAGSPHPACSAAPAGLIQPLSPCPKAARSCLCSFLHLPGASAPLPGAAARPARWSTRLPTNEDQSIPPGYGPRLPGMRQNKGPGYPGSGAGLCQ